MRISDVLHRNCRQRMGVLYSILGMAEDTTPNPITGLTSGEIKLIETSWAKLMEHSKESGMLIMKSFFSKFPDYIELFPFKDIPLNEIENHVRFKVHCNTIMFSLSQIISNINDSELFIASIEKLALNHASRTNYKGFQDLKRVIMEILKTLESNESLAAWEKFFKFFLAVIKIKMGE